MARQLLGPKKTRRLRERLGLPIVAALVRGGTGHRIDLCLEDGSIRCLWGDGTITQSAGEHAYARGATGLLRHFGATP